MQQTTVLAGWNSIYGMIRCWAKENRYKPDRSGLSFLFCTGSLMKPKLDGGNFAGVVNGRELLTAVGQRCEKNHIQK